MTWSEERTDPLSDAAVLAERAAEIGSEKLATDIVLLDMRGVVDYTDWFVVMSGRNQRQVQAIAEEVALRMKREHGLIPDRKSTRLNSSHSQQSRMPSSA